MTNEKINEIAVKFNSYCCVAEERYDEPKYVFAALLTLIDVFLSEGSGKQCTE